EPIGQRRGAAGRDLGAAVLHFGVRPGDARGVQRPDLLRATTREGRVDRRPFGSRADEPNRFSSDGRLPVFPGGVAATGGLFGQVLFVSKCDWSGDGTGRRLSAAYLDLVAGGRGNRECGGGCGILSASDRGDV